MKLRVVDIDLFLDYKLRQNKGARGQRLPYVKYLPLFTTRKGAAIRAERRSTGEPIGHMAIAVFYDLLAYSTGCHPRGVLADSEGGFSLEWLASEIKCPVDVLRDSLALLVRYNWLADDDAEIQPSMATGKVLTIGKPSAKFEGAPDSLEAPWHDVAVQLVDMWHEAGALQKKVADPADIKSALFERCKTDYAKADVILANAREYVATVDPEWMLKIVNWIKQGLATAPPKPIKAKRGIELAPEDVAAVAAWEAEMQQQYQAGQVSKEAMQSWGLL